MNTQRKTPAEPGPTLGKRPAEDPPGAVDAEDLNLTHPPGGDDLRAPHERDESSSPFPVSGPPPASGPRQVVEQAGSDVARGLIDSERRGVPNEVPDAGRPQPEASPGSEVPPAGIDRGSLASREDEFEAGAGRAGHRPARSDASRRGGR